MKRILALSLIAVAFLLSACAAQQEQPDPVMTMLQAQQQRQQALEERVTEMESSVATTTEPVRTAQANQFAQIEQIQRDLATLRGEVDALTMQTSNLQSTQDSMAATLDDTARRLKALIVALESQLAVELNLDDRSAPSRAPQTAQPAPEPTQADEAQPAADTAQPEPDMAPEPEPAPASDPAQALYDRALAAFEEGEYDYAQSLWAEFVDNFPDHELVPNALFWQGESFYKLERFDKAVLAYDEVIKRYPTSNKYPQALLKQGISWYKYGQPKAGSIVLNRLIKEFPESPETQRAQTFMSQN